MKTETRFIAGLERNITFNIGQNQNENFDIIDAASPDDLWFHAEGESSCHVICEMPSDITDKKKLRYIVKAGALMCKNNTNKLRSLKNVKIIYTSVKNIVKTEILGCVTTTNEKSISV